MYEFKLMRLIIILGIVGGMIGYFLNQVELGLIMGLAIGSVYMAIQAKTKSNDEG